MYIQYLLYLCKLNQNLLIIPVPVYIVHNLSLARSCGGAMGSSRPMAVTAPSCSAMATSFCTDHTEPTGRPEREIQPSFIAIVVDPSNAQA